MLDMGMTFSFGQLAMDNEFARMIKHVVKGIPVTDETLAVDTIREIGPFKDFLSHDSTLKHMKTVQSRPILIDRRMREDWVKSGETTITRRAEEDARQILKTHKPEPLPDGICATIRSIVEETERELGIAKGGQDPAASLG
jgi:trimethylamine--corrinoid protein Co-methyltransferase